MVELLKRLTEANGVSGNEGEVREIIKHEISSLVDDIYIDGIGNLIGYKKGNGNDPKKIMLCAHMDEVGFIISHISDNGMLKFKAVGGIDPRILVSKRVLIGKDEVPGVLGIKAIHLQEPSERTNAVKIDQMYIDIGAKSKEDAKKVVNLGDYGIFDSSLVEFGEGKIKAKALDDRVGCLAIIEALKEEYDHDIYACFTVQEEVGLRGAGVAAFHVKPDIAMIIEGTTCSDVAGVDKHLYTTTMGEGPAVTIRDGSSISDRGLVKLLRDIAEEKGIRYQLKKGTTGGNDAGAIHVSREGIATCVVSVPCRYIHSPSSVMDINDFKGTIELVKEFVKGCE
ncbi:MAG: M42 family metallopeptidase [Clostridiales bacterium]|nr:M42 family metallopeptidase [Clostridiales bacterium]